jgi:hypothetical protein
LGKQSIFERIEPKEAAMQKRLLLFLGLALVIVVGIAVAVPFLTRAQVSAETDIYASGVQAGCYIAAANDCRIHTDPFTINIATSKKLTFFQLVAIQGGTGAQTVIYDFHTDLSNPVPFGTATTYTPSLVAQDFAASCGKSYTLSLQGRDSGDANAFNLGLTTSFTCPSNVP